MRQICWISKHNPLPSQVAALKVRFPDHSIVTDHINFRNARDIISRYHELGGDQLVVIGPARIQRELVERGYRPLYAVMSPTTPEDSELTLLRPNRHGQLQDYHYRFKYFSHTKVSNKPHQEREDADVRLSRKGR